MSSHYEINVALNKQHLFATAERSCTTKWEYEKVLKIFKEKFPKSEGYEVTAIYWTCVGKKLNTKED